MMVNPPFVFGRVADRDNFIDREAERSRLVSNFDALVNTIIVSPRRWGKSSLVQRVAEDVQLDRSRTRVCLVDLFSVRTEAGFYAALAKAVMKATMSRWDEWVDAAAKFLTQLRPKIVMSADAFQEITLDVDWHQAELDPDEVLDLAERIAESKKLRLVVCIDEFQAIAGFADTDAFQRKLRSHWQQHQNVCYCLYGSKRHMLLDVFSSPEMPFYRFGDIMTLSKIDNAVWGDFIAARFAATGKSVTPDLGRQIAALADNHSYYTQQLAQQVWFRTDKSCQPSTIESAWADLTDQLGLVFTGLTDSLTTRQLNYLRAVLDGRAAMSAQTTIRDYNLGTSANVTRIREALVNREIVDTDGITILDPVFKHWLASIYFIQP